MFRSTDISKIEDRVDYYHMEFDLYDYETLSPAHIPMTFNILDRIGYNYMILGIDKDLQNGLINKCVFYMVADMSFDRKQFHLKIPKLSNNTIVDAINKKYTSEVYIDKITGSSISMVLVMIDNKLKRLNKLKKIKNNICHI